MNPHERELRMLDLVEALADRGWQASGEHWQNQARDCLRDIGYYDTTVGRKPCEMCDDRKWMPNANVDDFPRRVPCPKCQPRKENDDPRRADA